MPDSVMVNISHFDCDVLSSSLSPVSKDVGFSLSGKVPHCECGEQGSRPRVNQEKRMRLSVRVTCPSSFLSERQTKARKQQSDK